MFFFKSRFYLKNRESAFSESKSVNQICLTRATSKLQSEKSSSIVKYLHIFSTYLFVFLIAYLNILGATQINKQHTPYIIFIGVRILTVLCGKPLQAPAVSPHTQFVVTKRVYFRTLPEQFAFPVFSSKSGAFQGPLEPSIKTNDDATRKIRVNKTAWAAEGVKPSRSRARHIKEKSLSIGMPL